MLSALDLVIAFAVIMTVLSLFITILAQIVSSALALRGKNLANAIALTFQTIDPNIGEQAHSLAAQILRDPIFSDSIWRKKSRVVDVATLALTEAEKILAKTQLALAGTSDQTKKAELTKAVSERAAAVELAIANVAKLADLVKAELELKESEKSLAKTSDEATRLVLKKTVEDRKADVVAAQAAAAVPEVKDNRTKPWGFWTWPRRGARQLGNAIRPGEIYRALNEFADMTETQAALKDIPPQLVTKATALIAALGKKDRPTTESQEKLILISKVSDYFKANPQQQLAVVNSLANFGTTVERATTQAYDRFQRWFGSGQDRAEQWFQTHMRGVTIFMAFLTAFVLQLDTVDIYRLLRDQPKLVEALVKSAPNVLEQGRTVLDSSDTSAYHAYLLWLQKHPLFPLKTLPASGDQKSYQQALAARLKEAPDPEYPLQQFDSAFASAHNAEGFSNDTDATAAKSVYPAWVKNFPMLKLDPEPDFATATQQSIRDAIQAKINADPTAKTAPDPETASKWLTEYDGLQTAGTIALEKARQATFYDLKNKLDETGFDLAPARLLHRWDGEKVPKWAAKCPFLAHYIDHLLGLLMTAGLLALGAPFWFNLIKNLMNLRPAVAKLIEQRPTSAPALPTSSATPPSPS